MDPFRSQLCRLTRRHFLSGTTTAVGAMALQSLIADDAGALRVGTSRADAPGGLTGLPHHPPRAKQVIFLHMAGAPSQLDLFDYKPKLQQLNDQDCPAEYLQGERFAFIKGTPQLLGSPYQFAQHGQCGHWMSELLPHLASVADELAIVKSAKTDQFNHAPAQFMLHAGSSQFGKPATGAWVTYGLGSENRDLPGFVVLVSGGKVPSAGKSVWGSGFLPSVHQGVQCRTTGDPVLYLSNPAGMDRGVRRRSLDALRDLNQMHLASHGDPETESRIAQYELAYRMQISVPDVMDISRESAATLSMYGAEPGGSSFANNCLLARRLVEQDVRFVQLFDWGWDSHGTGKNDDLIHQFPKKCQETDRPLAALIHDLRQRGLLDETLVIWSGEFGRTPMNEKRNNSTFLGRDHHPHAFTLWMAGGGVKPGLTYGASDELGYFVTEKPLPVHDLQATILHLLGINPFEFHYPYLGLNQRLIGPTQDPQVHFDLLS